MQNEIITAFNVIQLKYLKIYKYYILYNKFQLKGFSKWFKANWSLCTILYFSKILNITDSQTTSHVVVITAAVDIVLQLVKGT